MKNEGSISLLLKENGNLLEQFLDSSKAVELLRVFPYESRCGDTILSLYRKQIEDDATPEDLEVLGVIDALRTKAREKGWSDNKIVIESFIGSWHIFVGYWDDIISIGLAVKPNFSYNPKYEVDEWGTIKRIKVR